MEFDSFATLSGYSDYELQQKFKKGLNAHLLDRIYALDQAPATMDTLKKEALRLEQQWRERQTFRKAPTTSGARTGGSVGNPTSVRAPHVSAPTSAPAPPAPAPREPDVKPMDLDRNRARNTGPRPRKCFDCGQEGHFRGDARCPHQARVLAEAVRAVLADLKVTVPGVPPTPETTSSTSGTSAGVFEEARE